MIIIQRQQSSILARRLVEPRRFIQVLAGPRQTGKTTIANQAADLSGLPFLMVSADDPNPNTTFWIESEWNKARLLAQNSKKCGALLILDEIHKIHRWSGAVKKLWDEDTRKKIDLKVILLGSSPFLMQRGLTESLAGRFENIPVRHWSFTEMKSAYNFDLPSYLYFGGYPGAAQLIGMPDRWKEYISASLIETTISKDILLLSRIDKPALLRQLFHLACNYSGQIVTYQKLTGLLQDAGNTTTLAHYLTLLEQVGMLAPLEKFSRQMVRQRASSPKLLVLNSALLSVSSGVTFEEMKTNPEIYGRFAESAVGAHLYNSSAGTDVHLRYWREGPREVDFVLQKGKKITAIEVKTGKVKNSLPGMEGFSKQFPQSKKIVVGTAGIPMEEFLHQPAELWM